jgi:hypothetical protein
MIVRFPSAIRSVSSVRARHPLVSKIVRIASDTIYLTPSLLATRFTVTVFAMILLLGFTSQSLQTASAATTVNYGKLGTFTQATTFTTGGITATTNGTFQVTADTANTYGGIGVVGGIGSDVIDSTESVLFTFDNKLATNVSVLWGTYTVFSRSTLPTIEAFGNGGVSLGAFNYSDDVFLSTLVGNQPLTAFRVTGGNRRGIDVASITYTSLPLPATGAAPEPTSLALILPVFTCAVVVRRRYIR